MMEANYCSSIDDSPGRPFSAVTSHSADLHLTPLGGRRTSVSASPTWSVEGVRAPSALMETPSLDASSWHDRAATGGKNNSAQDHMKYLAPEMPEPPCNIGSAHAVENRVTYRMAMRPDRNRYVTLNFRVMRHDAEMHVGQIVNLSHARPADLYTPRILDRWTLKLQVKLKSSVKVSVVFKSISARLGLQNTVGLKYSLDGFYGVEAFGDAFGNYGAGVCPWMEVTGDGSPISLQLEDGDNIYVCLANEKMVELAHRRALQVSEQTFKQGQLRASLMQPAVSVRAAVRPSETSFGSNTPFSSKQQESEIVELVL